MTLILPTDVVERAREMAGLYRPRIEEMFGVDLSGVGVKSFQDLPDDLSAFAQHLDAENPLSELEKELAAMQKAPGGLDREFFEDVVGLFIEKKTLGVYYAGLDTLYLPAHLAVSEGDLAMRVVHELGHAAVGRLVPFAKMPADKKLWRYVDEGFAEHLALSVMSPFSTQYGASSVCTQRAFSHMNFANLLAAMDDICCQMTERYIAPRPDMEQYDPHPVGYRFFTEVCARGISPREILLAPPQEFLEVLHPEEYLLRMRPEGQRPLPSPPLPSS